VYDNLIEGAKYRRVEGGYLVDWYRYQRNKRENPLVVVTAYLSKHSHLYVFLRSVFRALASYTGEASADLRLEAFPGLSQHKYLPVFAQAYSTDIARGIALTGHLLMDIQDVANAYGAQVLVVLFPSRLQVYPDLWDRARAIYGLDDSDYVLTKPNDILTAFCDQEHIPCLDLLPAFREASATAALYLPTDLHQSAAGQALAAQQVYEALGARELVPRE
jgi:hypothetical protein